MSASILRVPSELQLRCDEHRARGLTLGLVPTMGALHEGHLALVKEAREHASLVVVTIFVNPTQFGPNEDFQKYPRDTAGDIRKCEQAGAGLIFTPDVADMYPKGDATRVQVHGLTEYLCGPLRPGHFEGVATIVTKLFALVGRSVAVFGRKDYQQVKVIERLVADLMLPVKIVTHPTVRETDGLALSSRNAYLSADERERARVIPQALSHAIQQHGAGLRSASALRENVQALLTKAGLRVDYVSVADPETLVPVSENADVPDTALLAVAAFCGKTRLIDNVVLGRDAPPVAGGSV
ncbi:MAG: pantoate--beta-alanine ligase [Polyangiaceae bacterium]|nr:pantoate--beta-alanine ligase [Polyangiaceae bacterium]